MDRTPGYWLLALVAVVAVTAAATGSAPQQAPAPTPASERLASFATRQHMEKASLFQNLKFRNIGPVDRSCGTGGARRSARAKHLCDEREADPAPARPGGGR